MKRYMFAFLLSILLPVLACAQEKSLSYGTGKVYFRLGEVTIDLNYKDNRATLQKFVANLTAQRNSGTGQIGQLKVIASASPDGTIQANEKVVKQRAEAIADWVRKEIAGGLEYTVVFEGVDWDLLIRLIEENDKVPYRKEVLEVLRNEPEYITKGQTQIRNRYNKLLQVYEGESMTWIYRNLFPEMRYASVEVDVRQKPEPEPVPQVEPETPAVQEEPRPVAEPEPLQPEKQPFYMTVKTNLLYDVAFIPNIGIEFYLGHNWSVAANGQYIWLRNKAKHKYWRVGAGDVALRKWFGNKASQKPLTGHHIGAYGQMVTYDFAPTGKSGTIAEDWNWSVGLEYGYSLPIARRLNMDFTLGIGYHWGEYKKYDPIDDHSVWQATKQRSYFGPTKAEVSLVWLLGRGNYNKQKGGNR